MSELQFPKNPVVGQQYDFPPYKYYWDGTKWKTMGIGHNPVNELRDYLEPRIGAVSAQSFEALRRSYAEAGYNLVDGSFEDGGTLAATTDVLLQESTGAVYAWTGAFPKVVASGTNPATAGSGYVPRTDAVLRPQVRETMRRSYTDAGYNLVAGSFETGGTLTSATDVLLHEASGKAYSGPIGVVAAGTNPTSGGFVDRSLSTVEIDKIPGGGAVYGTKDYYYRVLFGVIRNSGSGWHFIEDATHQKDGFIDSVSVRDNGIVITYKEGFDVKKIGSLVVCPDETFASRGISCGASVGTTESLIRLVQPLNFILDTSAVTTGAASTSGVSAPMGFQSNVTAQRNSDNITINHPARQTNQAAVVSQLGASAPDSIHTGVSLGTSFTRLYFKRDVCGYITYTNGAWNAGSTPTAGNISMAWSVDHLIITTPATSAGDFDINLECRYPYTALVGAIDESTTHVYFKDAAGNLVTTPDSNMRILFKRSRCKCISSGNQDIACGSYAVDLGYTPLNPLDISDANGNLWIFGIMKV